MNKEVEKEKFAEKMKKKIVLRVLWREIHVQYILEARLQLTLSSSVNHLYIII